MSVRLFDFYNGNVARRFISKDEISFIATMVFN